MGVTSVLLHSLENQWSNTIVSDDSEDDDMLPTEEYWAIPDEEWTLVEPHANHVVLGSDKTLHIVPWMTG